MRCMMTLFLLAISFQSWPEQRLMVGDFSSGSLRGWEEKVFNGTTRYQIVELAVNDKTTRVLRAESQASASGRVREISIDLTKTPVLHWSWCVEKSLDNLDEQTKSGDDYAARIYVVVSGGLAFWKTRSLNYVWASKMPVGSYWPNAYAKNNVIMVAQQSGHRNAGQWHRQKTNIRDDFKRYFGKDIETIDAVAIMTDTDDSGQHVTAWYGDIFFSAK